MLRCHPAQAGFPLEWGFIGRVQAQHLGIDFLHLASMKALKVISQDEGLMTVHRAPVSHFRKQAAPTDVLKRSPLSCEGTRIRNLLKKLKFRSRVEAAVWAVANQLS